MYTIEDLRNGKCAVINDGTLQELQKVLKLAFPNETTAKKGNKHLYSRFLGGWSDGNYGGLPTQSVKDFLKKENMQTNVSNNSDDLFNIYSVKLPTEISRRDYFTAMAMQGILASVEITIAKSVVSEMSVEYADALIAELDMTGK
jgi:hypothetical protein